MIIVYSSYFNLWADDAHPLPFSDGEVHVFERPELLIFSVDQLLHERWLLVVQAIAFGDVGEEDSDIVVSIFHKDNMSPIV